MGAQWDTRPAGLFIGSIALFLLVVGCSDASPRPAATEAGATTTVAAPAPDDSQAPVTIDFMGQVAGVDFSDTWSIEPPAVALTRGGPSGEVRVGPQDIALVGGPMLRVPANTPGGNWCLDLIHPSQVADITGQAFATVDDVPRFERGTDWTAPCVIMGRYAPDGTVAWFQVLEIAEANGIDLAVVGDVREVDNESLSVTTADGYRFDLARVATECGRRPSEVRFLTALADWGTGTVVVLRCINTA